MPIYANRRPDIALPRQRYLLGHGWLPLLRALRLAKQSLEHRLLCPLPAAAIQQPYIRSINVFSH